MTTTPARTTALRAARAKDSHDKRRRVLAVLQALENDGTTITAAAVATAAGVSTWLVYADGIREHLDAARCRQAGQAGQALTPVNPSTPENRASITPASLRTDLAIARDQIRLLRTERDKLLGRLRLHLGAEIEGPERAELITRVANLEAAGRQLAADRDARTAEANQAQRHIQELEDDLAAARDSLRQVIKSTNR